MKTRPAKERRLLATMPTMTTMPIVFLLGLPGVGKSTLGSRACKELGLEFLDLAAADLEGLSRVVADRAVDVVELPWELQHERKALALARRSGVRLLLWAHPQDMQARSGRDEPLSRVVFQQGCL